MSERVTRLAEAQRDRQWQSTLTGTRYRWVEGAGWESKLPRSDTWYPVYASRPGQAAAEPVVDAYGGEYFLELL